MFRLAMTLFSMIATTLMGTFVVIALVAGYDTLVPLVAAAGLGLAVSVPAAWMIARALSS
ncbi:CTP synthetase [Psychromarinibacter halotolerans]|uniref:CTP synthetase n=1 Tax=Psychromarinibacter halotolerans TaxID=1775175 RepID=A0ABV7GU79_9RHOB|nr:CTP synthetase [Psychromarinibacter halotolerans]MAQ84302.1 CTP synthetase [Maritimibacter sp.]MDF0597207.1 CTP synthetase [Psychromarinibacter halotolerans]